MELLGQEDFDIYAGKIMQLKFCEESAFGKSRWKGRRTISTELVGSSSLKLMYKNCALCTISVHVPAISWMQSAGLWLNGRDCENCLRHRTMLTIHSLYKFKLHCRWCYVPCHYFFHWMNTLIMNAPDVIPILYGIEYDVDVCKRGTFRTWSTLEASKSLGRNSTRDY